MMVSEEDIQGGLNFDTGYFLAPNDLFEKDGLTNNEKIVYLYFCRCGNNGAKIFPSYNKIAEKCSMSRRTAINVVDSLFEKGLLTKKARMSEDRQTSNLYEVNLPSAMIAPPLVQQLHPPSAIIAPYKELSTTNQTDKVKTLTPKREKRTYSEDDQYYQMAEYLHNAIMRTAEANGKKHLVEKADMQKWADDFRKMVELDGRSNLQEIKAVIEFATTDSFWQTNILSAKKLREKYATLAMKAGQKPKKTNNLAERGDDQRSRLKNKILGGATVDRTTGRANLLQN